MWGGNRDERRRNIGRGERKGNARIQATDQGQVLPYWEQQRSKGKVKNLVVGGT